MYTLPGFDKAPVTVVGTLPGHGKVARDFQLRADPEMDLIPTSEAYVCP
jgi:hypothetical protein